MADDMLGNSVDPCIAMEVEAYYGPLCEIRKCGKAEIKPVILYSSSFWSQIKVNERTEQLLVEGCRSLSVLGIIQILRENTNDDINVSATFNR
jgi:hypothetical protein